MTAPVGWKNLSPIRRKATSQDSVTAAVHESHPRAQARWLGAELLAYFVDGTSESRIVALAWIDRAGLWSYAVQSRVAYDIGMRCEAVQIAGSRYRVLPIKADQSPTVQRQVRAQQIRAQRSGRYTPEYRRFQPHRYRDGDNWWIEFQVQQGVELYGPYPTNYALDKDLTRLLENLMKRECASGTLSQKND